MTIKQRLAVGFTVLITLTIALTVFSILTMGDIQARVNLIVEISAKRVELAEKVKKNILRYSIFEKKVILARTNAEIEENIDLANRHIEIVDKSLVTLSQVVAGGEEKYLDDFYGAWGSYLVIARKVHQLVRENSRDKARQYSEKTGGAIFEVAMDTLLRLKKKIEPNRESKLPVAEQTYRSNFNEYIENVEAHLFAVREGEQEVVFNQRRKIDEAVYEEINDSKYYIDRNLRDLLSTSKDDDKDDLRWVMDAVAKYIESHNYVIDLEKKNTQEQAYDLSLKEGEGKLLEVMKLLDQIIVSNEHQMQVEQLESSKQYLDSRTYIIASLVFVSIITAIGGFLLARSIVAPLNSLISTTKNLAAGDSRVRSEVSGNNEVGVLAQSFNTMAETIDERVWLQTALNQLANSMRGSQEISALAQNVISALCEVTGVSIGAIYIHRDDSLCLVGSYAYQHRKTGSNKFDIGEGFVGQAALEKKQLLFSGSSLESHDLVVSSGVSELQANNIVVQPLIFNDRVGGVAVLGSTSPLEERSIAFLSQVSENIAIAIDAAESHIRQAELLQATQKQAAELHQQQEKLGDANTELENKTKILEDSQSQLRLRGEELENSNAELERQTVLLEEQKKQIEKAKEEVEVKAEEIEQASKYKSEFLANMSHELRTPLNSLLLLSKTLTKNQHGNLTDQQVESLNIIHTGGQDLLCLINDILDLSKVEAGHLEVYFEPMGIQELCGDLEILFGMLMKDKGINFEINIERDVAEKIQTDKKRVTQILRNFLSNAFKFTHAGTIELRIYVPSTEHLYHNKRLSEKDVIAFSVKDSGIGIPEEKQRHIFEAFQQADGSTSRKYGGTGLGLAISKELSGLLNGEIQLESEDKKGSTFTLYLPIASINELKSTVVDHKVHLESENDNPAVDSPAAKIDELAVSKVVIEDDRALLKRDDRILLIIEDDIRFSRIMMDIAHARSFKCIRAGDGQSGIQLAQEYIPNVITLDLGLPDIDGNQVLSELKSNESTKDIPVHVITANDRTQSEHIDVKGAEDYLSKPIEPDDLEKIFGKIYQPDDRELPSANNETTVEKVAGVKEVSKLASESSVSSSLDVESTHAGVERDASHLEQPAGDTACLDGKVVLIVDDDIRNMFALSEIMMSQGMKVVKADNGELAVEKMSTEEKIDIVLMDIMMPVMDGYEATREIRQLDDCEGVPIIALTAKAMPDDRNLCISAGATEYLPKPIEENKLLGVMGRLLS